MIGLSRSVLFVMAVLSLVACGKKEGTAAPAASASATAALKPEPVKVAWVYAGPVADGGSTYAHDRGRMVVETEFAGQVEVSIAERVRDGAEAEQAIRDLAAKGNKLIFSTSPGFERASIKVAGEFPDVKFELAYGLETTENLRPYTAKAFECAYLAGVIAGKTTRSRILGFVASVPNPEVLRDINAFTLGAQSVESTVKTKVAWVNSWFDPAKEGLAAQRLINDGADVLMQSTHSTAVLQTAEANGKHAFGWGSDMSVFAPRAHLASCTLDWGAYYKRAVREVIDGKWTPLGTAWWGTKEGQVAIVGIGDAVPADVRDRVEQLSTGIKSGSFSVFSGPLLDNAGQLRLPVGRLADQGWLSMMAFFVKGVEGEVPARN